MFIHYSILTTIVDNSWVLVKVSNAQTHRAAHHVPGRWIGRGLDGDFQVIIRKAWPWTIVGNVLREDPFPVR